MLALSERQWIQPGGAAGPPNVASEAVQFSGQNGALRAPEAVLFRPLSPVVAILAATGGPKHERSVDRDRPCQ
jgi:hypothetical protein